MSFIYIFLIFQCFAPITSRRKKKEKEFVVLPAGDGGGRRDASPSPAGTSLVWGVCPQHTPPSEVDEGDRQQPQAECLHGGERQEGERTR